MASPATASSIHFEEEYYETVIERFGYNRIDFRRLDFDLNGVDRTALERMWLCHHEGDVFAASVKEGRRAIVTTGIGLSGPPHIGTVSQILRSIFLQKSGLEVQFVLGDLDSYNARNQPLSLVQERAQQYVQFIERLGFDRKAGILRTQSERLDVLHTAYLIANCLTDEDFRNAEEDLSAFYRSKGVYPGIEFPVKLAILLMTADFVHLGRSDAYLHVLVMLGLEEHLYVLLAKKVVTRMKIPIQIGAMYSRIIRGLNNYPKMSKSLPGSAVSVDTPPEDIRRLLLEGDGAYVSPLDSVVFQMMCAVSYCPDELRELYRMCAKRSSDWQKRKREFADMLIAIAEAWPR